MFSKQASTIVLYATVSFLVAGVWRNRKLLSFQVFQHDDAGKIAFKQFLQINVESKIYLIVDAVEEDYRLETLPHTTGNERSELLARKLNHAYRGLNFRMAHFIARDTDKRKDDKYLFAALNNTDFLQSWLDCIEMLQAQLVGIYLLPMISQAIVAKLNVDAPHILLCELLESGLRQTYLHKGHIRMSRLASIQGNMQSKLGYNYLVETEKTRLYLISQRYLAKDTQLDVVLPTLDMANNEMRDELSLEQGFDCRNVDLKLLAKSEGIDPSLLQSNPELLHMQLLINGVVPDSLAPSNLTKSHQIQHIKYWLITSAWMVASLGLLAVIYYLLQLYDGHEKFQQVAQETVFKQRQYDEVAKNFPVAPVASEDLKVAVELEKQLISYPMPHRMMQLISQALETEQMIQINRVHWMLTTDVQVVDNEVAAEQQNMESNSQSGASLYEIAFINGEIKGFSGDYRQGLATVKAFTEKLTAIPDVARVIVVQEPVNVSSMSTLQGATTDAQASIKPSAVFKIKLILKSKVAGT